MKVDRIKIKQPWMRTIAPEWEQLLQRNCRRNKPTSLTGIFQIFWDYISQTSQAVIWKFCGVLFHHIRRTPGWAKWLSCTVFLLYCLQQTCTSCDPTTWMQHTEKHMWLFSWLIILFSQIQTSWKNKAFSWALVRLEAGFQTMQAWSQSRMTYNNSKCSKYA